MQQIQSRDQLCALIEQWNSTRLDLFAVTSPDENLEFHGVMRFYFQEAEDARVATKCVRVSSTASARDVIDALVEKFHPDMKMLTPPDAYALWEAHEDGRRRKLNPSESPLLVQLAWSSSDLEGRFLLQRLGDLPESICTVSILPHERDETLEKQKCHFQTRDGTNTVAATTTVLSSSKSGHFLRSLSNKSIPTTKGLQRRQNSCHNIAQTSTVNAQGAQPLYSTINRSMHQISSPNFARAQLDFRASQHGGQQTPDEAHLESGGGQTQLAQQLQSQQQAQAYLERRAQIEKKRAQDQVYFEGQAQLLQRQAQARSHNGPLAQGPQWHNNNVPNHVPMAKQQFPANQKRDSIPAAGIIYASPGQSANAGFQATTAGGGDPTAMASSLVTPIREIPALLDLPNQACETQFLRDEIFGGASASDANAVDQFTFQLTPAFAIYMACRYRLSNYFVPPYLPVEIRVQGIASFVNKFVDFCFDRIHANPSDYASLMLWLANSSELLHAFNADAQLRACARHGVQPRLMRLVETVYELFVEYCRVALRPGIHRILDAGVDYVNNGAEADEIDQMASENIVALLDEIIQLTRRACLNSALTIQLFSQLFHYVNMYTFNWLVTTQEGKSHITLGFGLRLGRRIARLREWAERKGLEQSFECHMDRIQQTVELLVTPKTSNHIARLGATCYKLNSHQIRYLLENYSTDPATEQPVADELIRHIVYLASTQADAIDAQDSIPVQLEEFQQLQLPFLFPDDAYVIDRLRGVPPELMAFMISLQKKSIARLLLQNTAAWTCHFGSDDENLAVDHVDSSLTIRSVGTEAHQRGGGNGGGCPDELLYAEMVNREKYAGNWDANNNRVDHRNESNYDASFVAGAHRNQDDYGSRNSKTFSYHNAVDNDDDGAQGQLGSQNSQHQQLESPPRPATAHSSLARRSAHAAFDASTRNFISASSSSSAPVARQRGASFGALGHASYEGAGGAGDSRLGGAASYGALQNDSGHHPSAKSQELIQRVTIYRRQNEGIGLSIVAGQANSQPIGIYVKKVLENSPAYRNGELASGDQLLSVNGQSLIDITQEEAASKIASSGREVQFEVAKGAAKRNGLADWIRADSAPNPTGSTMAPNQASNFARINQIGGMPPSTRHHEAINNNTASAMGSKAEIAPPLKILSNSANPPSNYASLQQNQWISASELNTGQPSCTYTNSSSSTSPTIAPQPHIYSNNFVEQQRQIMRQKVNNNTNPVTQPQIHGYSNSSSSTSPLPPPPTASSSSSYGGFARQNSSGSGAKFARHTSATASAMSSAHAHAQNVLSRAGAAAAARLNGVEATPRFTAQLQQQDHRLPYPFGGHSTTAPYPSLASHSATTMATTAAESGRRSAPLFGAAAASGFISEPNNAVSYYDRAVQTMSSDEMKSELGRLQLAGLSSRDDICRYRQLIQRLNFREKSPTPIISDSRPIMRQVHSASVLGVESYHPFSRAPGGAPGAHQLHLPFLVEMTSRLENGAAQKPRASLGDAAPANARHTADESAIDEVSAAATRLNRISLSDAPQLSQRQPEIGDGRRGGDEFRAENNNGSAATTTVPSLSAFKRGQFSALDARDENEEPRAMILGAGEVYNDPRQRRLNEEFQAKALKPVVDGSSLGFRDKMKLFAEQLGEKTPKNRQKISSAQREIELEMEKSAGVAQPVSGFEAMVTESS